MHATERPLLKVIDSIRALAQFLILGCLATLAGAQSSPAPAGPSLPSSFHERLAFFEGTWTGVGIPPEDNFVETCAWLPEGRRHMVCRSRWTSPKGPTEGMSIFSYSTKDAAYQYHGFRSGGGVVVQRGTEEGGVWRFFDEEGAGATLRRTRVTIRSKAPGTFTFVRETAIADGPWKAGDEVRYQRITR